MGKMLAALSQAGVPVPAAEMEPDGPREAEPEVPFIEVGPHKSMEASASVLASRPAPPPETPAAPAPPMAAPVSPLMSVPLGVTFRATAGPRRPRLGVDVIAYHRPEHPVSEQYRRLLAAMTAATPASRTLALFLSPALNGADSPLVLLNVAVTAARHGRAVVVVEGHLHPSRLGERLGLGPGPGLREVLAGSATLEQALRETDQDLLSALSAGAPTAARGVRFAAETTRSLLRQLRQRFDLVLVDGPPWDGRPEVVLLATACDAVYLVVPEAEAEAPRIDQLVQVIPGQGAALAGCILVG
jgi:Mrp family chromosome partitioning ATPase